MIGATDHADAMRQAARSTDNPDRRNLEIWDGTRYVCIGDCNVGVGVLGDTVSALKLALAYLLRHYAPNYLGGTTVRISREELARMAIQVDPPQVNRVTTVSNISTTTRFPVERADNAKRPPQTRPPVAARPQPQPPQQAPAAPRRDPSPMRDVLQANLRHRPAHNHPIRGMPPGSGNDEGRPDGVGHGTVPKGGVKMQ
jgi:hypothetical protein